MLYQLTPLALSTQVFTFFLHVLKRPCTSFHLGFADTAEKNLTNLNLY